MRRRVHALVLVKAKLLSTLSKRRPLWFVAAAILVAGLCNALFVIANDRLFVPFFLDSIFTACAAALLGWLPGVIVGAWTNLAYEIIARFPMTNLPFAVCNMATGLIVGLMADTGRFRTALQLLIAILLVTAANSLLGAVIVTFMYGGITGSAAVDYIVVGLLAAGRKIFSAAFLARIPVNLVDKGIAVGAAYALAHWLFRRYGWTSRPKRPADRNE